MPNIEQEQINPQNQIDEDYQLYQIEHNIFYNGDEPQRDNRFRCYEYSLFLFYKVNVNISIRDEVDNHLMNNWRSSGQWNVGNYKVLQYDGQGPIDIVNQNYNIIKERMDRLKNRGQIEDYRIRRRYPELP